MITIIIVLVTTVVSLYAFKNRDIVYKLSLNPYSVVERKEWYRAFTCSLVHSDTSHLFVNMFVLWSFGSAVENSFEAFGYNDLIKTPALSFVLLYVGGVIFASIPDITHKSKNPMYNSIGASGGVSAVLFASIFISPWSKLYLFFIIPLPQIIFGVAYLAYCYYMDKNSRGTVNHKAHLWGAIYGVIYMIALNYEFLGMFLHKLLNF